MFLRFVLQVTALSLLLCPLAHAEEATLAVFSRHTFRGVGDWMGPLHVKIGALELDLPSLGYGMDATQHGLQLAEKFGSHALQEAAEKAVRGLGSPYRPHWDEIRADLASERDFFTGLYFREGLQPEQTQAIALTGCPTREGEPIDAVTVGYPVRRHIPKPELRKLQIGSANARRYEEAGNELLQALAPVAGATVKLPPVFDNEGNMRPEYSQLRFLAQFLEMVAEQGPPLRTLFPRLPANLVAAIDPNLVRKASAYLGMAFIHDAPMEVAYAAARYPVEYVQSLPPGRRVIMLSHDDDLSMLMRSLGLMDDAGPADLRAVYPMESLVIALDSQRACVVRMRMQLAPDGSFPGTFASTVVWQGSRDEWQAKVQTVLTRAAAWPVAREAREQVKVLPAAPLDVRYRTR
jgi:hypothetical protein